MLSFRGKVAFTDGTETEFEGGTAALAAYEEYAIRNNLPYGERMPPTLAALVIAWHCLGVEEGFAVWRKRVTNVEMEAEGVPPMSAGALTG